MINRTSWPRTWRLFITTPVLQALAMGWLASLVAAGLSAFAPVTFAALDWTLYDMWLRLRAPIAASETLATVVRDPESQERFGSELDRAILARMITALHEAGATVIGVDHRLDHPSADSGGGAASDALFIEALTAAAPVVLIHDPETALESSALLTAHVLLSAEPDNVARRIPVLSAVDGQKVPAFGVLLYDLYRRQALGAKEPPLTDREDVTLNPVGDGSLSALPTTGLSSVWDAIQHHDRRQLEQWFNGKIVVILPGRPANGPWLLPTGQSVPGVVAHLHLVNSLLTGKRADIAGRWPAFALTLLLGACVGWIVLRFKGSAALMLAVGLLVLYVTVTAVLLWIVFLLLPLSLPLSAAAIVVVGTILWTHLTTGPRIMLLEQEMLRVQQDAAAVREALTLRETRAERLEEDLEVAKAEAAQSRTQQEDLAKHTALLQVQIVEARDQEQAVRRQLEKLEEQLNHLRVAASDSGSLGDTELDRLADDCRAVGIITRDPALLRMFHDLKKAAASPLTVLLLGEPGTGKELFARAVHRLSRRASEPFVAVNMAAVPAELFESELFGHVKGSFTGATAERRGYFELADRGTIFLDEIGDLRLDHQSKLLRVLQEKSFYRVGATVATAVNVRIVAATNRDLQRGVTEGWFREDLYFRLKGFVFRLPPLRERRGDIPVIADSALADIAQRMGKPRPRISMDAVRLLSAHRWPGNVRELLNIVERAVALVDGEILSPQAFVFDDLFGHACAHSTLPRPDDASDSAVLESLRRQDFDMQATAKILGWDRSTVTQRLKGLCFQALVQHEGDLTKAAMAIAGDLAHLRTVELKLRDYHQHLLRVIEPFSSTEDAVAECKRRFKNLPDRHFASVALLVRQQMPSTDNTAVRPQRARQPHH